MQVQGALRDFGAKGFDTEVQANVNGSSNSVLPPAPPNIRPTAATLVGPGYCWHDDHAFLPAGASAGLPCGTTSTGTTVDPGQVARAMFDHLDLPDLTIGMNPRLGMVAVPTWFWVEGYSGGVVPLTDNLVVTHQECSIAPDRDASGAPMLDAAGAPSTHRDCRTLTDTVTVQVRAWPRTFHWDFGDDHDQMVRCPDLDVCSAGMGIPFTHAQVPSPIAHAYRWSSLGINGEADAYSIGLGITFAAQFRFSINGRSASGWQDLGERGLAWSATHRVQEAQAVLTRPCPVSVLRC
jgi:hypothetical protein